MGGGVSLIEGVEELMTTTILIGRAISAMQMPGMFRLYDFHSKQAPRLKNARPLTFFAPDSDDEGEEEEEFVADPNIYERFFKVTVNGDDIYIENPIAENDSGWTPLHTCCMSISTASAGLALIEETIRLGGNFETKTKVGPGTFNQGWTPLQMACAYGIDVLVEKLVQCGANVNATNCFGFSCLHEACHRGFADVVRHLLKSGSVNLSYVPSDEEAIHSPFASAPSQTVLAEAARCGFFKIVQMLIDGGAIVDYPNRLGWTALHEACFYHRLETVKTLLNAGADASARTSRGALPYHLAGLPEIRLLLQNKGGPEAVPTDEDVVDMIQVLTDLTLADIHQQVHAQQQLQHANQHRLDSTGSTSSLKMITTSTGAMDMPLIIISPGGNNRQQSHFNTPMNTTITATTADAKRSSEDKSAVSSSSSAATAAAVTVDAKGGSSSSESKDRGDLLHDGALLGQLPSLNKVSPGKAAVISKRADGKEKKKTKKRSSTEDEVPADMPREFLCQLTHRPMSEPMKTIYGNVYDKTAIMNWFQQQGRICPLTGAPLAEVDLTAMDDLGNEIRRWILKKSIAQSNDVPATTATVDSSVAATPAAAQDGDAKKGKNTSSRVEDDLYDF